MITIFIPFICFGALLFLYQQNNKWRYGPISLMISIYLIMSFLSIILEFAFDKIYSHELNASAIVYLSLFLAVGLVGFFSFNDNKLLVIRIENTRILQVVEMALLLFSLCAILFFLPFAYAGLSGDVEFARTNMSVQLEALGAWGYVNSFFSTIANLFALNIVFALLALARDPLGTNKHRVKSMLQVCASTCYIFYILAYVGRDGFVLWVLTFLFLYMFFRPFLNKAYIRQLKFLFGVVFLIAFLPFIYISFSRFSGRDVGFLFEILRYGGEQVRQFSDHFSVGAEPQWGRLNFPLLSNLMSKFVDTQGAEFDRLEWYKLYTELDVTPWSFSTFVGSFVHDFGPYITGVIVVAISCVSHASLRQLRAKGEMSLSSLVLFLLCAQIVMYGVFYFRQMSANLAIIATLIIAIIFRLSYSRRRCRKINRITGVERSADLIATYTYSIIRPSILREPPR